MVDLADNPDYAEKFEDLMEKLEEKSLEYVAPLPPTGLTMNNPEPNPNGGMMGWGKGWCNDVDNTMP